MTILSKFSNAQSGGDKQAPDIRHAGAAGFSLVESLMAILVFALGLMFVGPMMFDSVGLTSLARSKDTAGLAATNQLESLSLRYKANPDSADFTNGVHGPEVVEVANPVESTLMNRYNVRWTVGPVPDVRAGKVLRAVLVTVAVTPLGSGTEERVLTGQNKVIHASTILSFRTP
jgi:type II secretory pathway pseudopilin PulG